jgi:tetratricopeptide (TPR) repeat protein
VLPLNAIVNEIQASVDFLSVEMQGIPQRQWSIRAVFETTWRRLSVLEQQVFMHLSVFRGGCTREAAEVVIGVDFRVMQSLMNKSLLQRTLPDRYEIHELLRQYAEQNLNVHISAITIRDKHMVYYAAYMAECDTDIKGRKQQQGLVAIESEFENIRSAWHWAVQRENYSAIGQMLEGLDWFCYFRHLLPQCRELFEVAQSHLSVEPSDSAHQAVRRRLMMWWHGFFAPDMERIEQLLLITRKRDSPQELAFCLYACGNLFFRQRDYVPSITCFEESFTLYQTQNDKFYAAHLLTLQGYCYGLLKDTAHYIEYMKKSLALRREIGDQIGISNTLLSVGTNIAWLKSDWDEARKLFREAATIALELRNFGNYAIAKAFHGFFDIYAGNLVQGEKQAQEALTIAQSIGHALAKAWALNVLGFAASIKGDYRMARQLSMQSLETATFTNELSGGISLGLSVAACGLAEYDTAKQLVLKLLGKNEMVGLELQLIFPQLVLILAHEAHLIRAVEVLGLAFTHPYMSQGILVQWQPVVQVQQRLRSQLEPNVYDMAWQRGKQSDVTAIVDELLDELGKTTSGD